MFADVEAQKIVALGVSLGIGLLIGIERGWAQRDRAPGERAAGIRTFALLGLSGGVLGVLASGPAAGMAIVAAVAFIALPVIAYRDTLSHAGDSHSVTNAVAAILTLCLGMLATTGFESAAVICAAATMALLASRERLHGWLRLVDEKDIKAAAQFAIIALVVLPLLPDTEFGPYGAFNPRKLWMVVVFVTGLSFAGYWASKRLGATRGTLAAVAIGASYSSTAITAELAQRLRRATENATVLRAGIAVATAVMLVRVLLLATILAPHAALVFASLVAPAALVASGWAAAAVYRADKANCAPIATQNPFALLPAIGFAVLVGVVLLASKWAIARYGDDGFSTLLALTGLYDVDAAIITAGTVDPGAISPNVAGRALAITILVNTLLKGTIVLVLGGIERGARAAAPLAASAALLSGAYVLAQG